MNQLICDDYEITNENGNAVIIIDNFTAESKHRN